MTPHQSPSRSLGTRLVSALVAPPFDPRAQSWFAAIASAAQVIVGAGLFLLFAGGVLSGGAEHRMTTRAVFEFIAVSGPVSTSLLFAGLSLMFGWQNRRKAQALLWAVLLVVGFGVLLMKSSHPGW